MNTEKSFHHESEQKTSQLNLNELTLPIHILHVKSGGTLCANDNILILQDGSTAMDIRIPPKFISKRIPWRNGLVRDIVWCSDLNVFLLLTKAALFSISPKCLVPARTITNNPAVKLIIKSYSKIKPYNNDKSFWRCTCVGKTLYIIYSGYGTVIDEYSLGISSCKFVNRWTPPKTCATHEGIWCIRSHPDTDQLGFSIIDATNNQWRFDLRSRQTLDLLWQTVLPLLNGDCEISPLPNAEWLAINSCGIRLVQIANEKLKSAVEYSRELKNVVSIGHLYFVVRTKNTIEIHQVKSSK